MGMGGGLKIISGFRLPRPVLGDYPGRARERNGCCSDLSRSLVTGSTTPQGTTLSSQLPSTGRRSSFLQLSFRPASRQGTKGEDIEGRTGTPKSDQNVTDSVHRLGPHQLALLPHPLKEKGRRLSERKDSVPANFSLCSLSGILSFPQLSRLIKDFLPYPSAERKKASMIQESFIKGTHFLLNCRSIALGLFFL